MSPSLAIHGKPFTPQEASLPAGSAGRGSPIHGKPFAPQEALLPAGFAGRGSPMASRSPLGKLRSRHSPLERESARQGRKPAGAPVGGAPARRPVAGRGSPTKKSAPLLQKKMWTGFVGVGVWFDTGV